MPKKAEPRIEGSLDGLAERFDGAPSIRKYALETSKLCKWPKPEKTGQMSLANAALNHEILEIIIRLWAPQFTAPIMVPVDLLKDQVGDCFCTSCV